MGLKQFEFNKEMEKDVNEIRQAFQIKFKIRPSNKSIMNLLLKTYKEVNINITKKPKTRKKFIIEI